MCVCCLLLQGDRRWTIWGHRSQRVLQWGRCQVGAQPSLLYVGLLFALKWSLSSVVFLSVFFFFFDCTCSSSSFVTLLYSSFPSWSHCPLLLLLALCCLILSPVFCPLHCMCCCSLLFFLCILLSSFVSSCLFYSVSGLPSTSCFHCYTTTTATFFVLFIFIPPLFVIFLLCPLPLPLHQSTSPLTLTQDYL